MPEERTTRHSHYNLNYHLVFTPKYRKHTFFGEVREKLMQVFRNTCAERDWQILGMEVLSDHVHLFVSVPPKWSPSDVAKILKGVSARRILQEYPKLRQRSRHSAKLGRGSGHLWTPSFYVGSAGNISSDVIQRYIQDQRKHQEEDGDE